MAEYRVISRSELSEGQLKPARAGQTELLLIQIQGTIHAVQPLCPHYSMPLADGVVCNGRLRCGWHQSVFDIASGNVLEPPAPNGLKKYPVRVDGDAVYVSVDEPVGQDQRIVIIGGGASGFMAAKTLREKGFAGDLTILSADSRPPYDRPNLSKDYLAGHIPESYLPLGDERFYQERKIVLRLQARVSSIQPAQRTVTLDDQTKLPYDQLLIATGCIPLTLDVPGSELAGIHTLRTRDDTDRLISEALHHRDVVIVGGSFIAMETAAGLRQRGANVTVVICEKQPMQRAFGDAIGAMIRRVHEAKGVRIVSERSITRFEGQGRVQFVTLSDGAQLPANLVLLGVGVKPATDFLRCGLGDFISDDGGIRVDPQLAVRDRIYAAGDVAIVPLPHREDPVRIEHWRFAEQLGRLAARNMLGQNRTFDEVPYFWTFQFDTGLDYAGHVKTWEELLIDGDIDRQDFMACYVNQNRIEAICSSGRSQQVSAVMELMKRDAMPSPDAVRGGGFDYVAAMRAVVCA